MKKYIFKNKKTGKKVITGEKLDRRQWELISEIRSGQMDNSKIWTKNTQQK